MAPHLFGQLFLVLTFVAIKEKGAIETEGVPLQQAKEPSVNLSDGGMGKFMGAHQEEICKTCMICDKNVRRIR